MIFQKMFLASLFVLSAFSVFAQEEAAPPRIVEEQKPNEEESPQSVQNPAEMREEEALLFFDDHKLLDAYAQKYQSTPKEILIQMLDDESLSSYQLAASARIFREKFVAEMVADDKESIDLLLLKCLNRSTSPFVQVEVMYTLITMDRYKYFPSMIPLMIQKLDHYNDTVNEIAFAYLNAIIDQQPDRSREAQIVFNSINKVLFLSRNYLTDVKDPSPRLTQKLKLLRWSIKILGTDGLDKLPKEVIGLL